MDFFKNHGGPPAPQNPMKDYTPEFDSLNNNLQQLTRMMQQYFQAGQAKESHMEIRSFDSGVQTIDTHGYRYIGMFVAAAQTITLTLAGLSYSLSLQPGLNTLNLLDGTQLSTQAPFQFVLYYSDYPFMEDSLGVAVNNTANTQIVGSTVMVPTDSQSHLATTIQTHNAVSIAASGQSKSSWFDTNGYNKIALNVVNDAATSNNHSLYWSNDGSTECGWDFVLASATQQKRSVSTDTKARYVQVVLNNNDTVAHTMSSWIYLQA